MKNVMFAISFVIGVYSAATAQNGKMESSPKMKKHACTKSCTNEKHAYAHGEKNHQCTDDCKKMDMKKEGMMKEHTCNKECSKEKHAFMHGEKNHMCTASCEKM
jgi:hypothetical protein